MTNTLGLNLSHFAEVADFAGRSGEPPNPRTFMAAFVSPSAVAAVLDFAFPRFVEYRNCVFLEFAFHRQAVDDWFEHLEDASTVEAVVNHVHLWDILGPSENLEYEARQLLIPLSNTWTVALLREFPERAFHVDARVDGDYGPDLSFHSA